MQGFIKEEWGKGVINKRKGIIVSGLVTFFWGKAVVSQGAGMLVDTESASEVWTLV